MLQFSLRFSKFSTIVISDINECEEPELHSCHPHSDCKNTVGSYFCTCHVGYHGDGVTCDPVECPLLDDLQNGSVKLRGHSYGDLVQFECNSGYRMEGGGVLKCLETGHWSGRMPKCRGKIKVGIKVDSWIVRMSELFHSVLSSFSHFPPYKN